MVAAMAAVSIWKCVFGCLFDNRPLAYLIHEAVVAVKPVLHRHQEAEGAEHGDGAGVGPVRRGDRGGRVRQPAVRESLQLIDRVDEKVV